MSPSQELQPRGQQYPKSCSCHAGKSCFFTVAGDKNHDGRLTGRALGLLCSWADAGAQPQAGDTMHVAVPGAPWLLTHHHSPQKGLVGRSQLTGPSLGSLLLGTEQSKSSYV